MLSPGPNSRQLNVLRCPCLCRAAAAGMTARRPRRTWQTSMGSSRWPTTAQARAARPQGQRKDCMPGPACCGVPDRLPSCFPPHRPLRPAVQDIVVDLMKEGYVPSWCTACYRKGEAAQQDSSSRGGGAAAHLLAACCVAATGSAPASPPATPRAKLCPSPSCPASSLHHPCPSVGLPSPAFPCQHTLAQPPLPHFYYPTAPTRVQAAPASTS